MVGEDALDAFLGEGNEVKAMGPSTCSSWALANSSWLSSKKGLLLVCLMPITATFSFKSLNDWCGFMAWKVLETESGEVAVSKISTTLSLFDLRMADLYRYPR